MGNPAYHLRPNKAVDRNLFVESLVKIERIVDLSDYRYIGFGSYEFDEFKLIYRYLGIEDLHSIEMDSNVFRRQSFNKPYSCIELYNKTCGAYFDEDYDENKHSIIWVDFSVANDKYAQCQDIANISGKLQAGDIFRITVNANSSGVPTGDYPGPEIPRAEKKVARYTWLKSNLGKYFPDNSSETDITDNGYPLFLLKVIKKAVYQDLNSELFACPISNYVYSDNTQMMTLTLFIGLSSEKEDILKRLSTAYKGWECYININEWEEPMKIDLPPLTVHEQLEIKQHKNTDEDMRKIWEEMGIQKDEVERYLRFARYYPNFQPVLI